MIEVLGFTGTSKGLTPFQRQAVNAYIHKHPEFTEFHHGDCIEGDSYFHDVILELRGIDAIFIHPCTIKTKRAYRKSPHIFPPKEPLVRNHDIVNAATKLLACPKGFKEEMRSGTWATIRYAKKRRIPITMIYPSGNLDILS